MKLYNITFKLDDLRDVLVPNIPETAGDTEDKTIKRVCLADSVAHCIQALAPVNREICNNTKFIVREADIPLTKKTLVHPKVLKEHGYVPDALENNEYWSLEPVRFKIYLCEIEHFDSDFTVSWSCITREQIINIIAKYTKTQRFCKYKTSKGVYNDFCRFINEKTRFATEKQRNIYYNMYDLVWDELVELPWAQKTEITNLRFRVIREL